MPEIELPPPALRGRHSTYALPQNSPNFDDQAVLCTGERVTSVASHTFSRSISQQRSPYGLIRAADGSSRVAAEWKWAEVASPSPDAIKNAPVAAASPEKWRSNKVKGWPLYGQSAPPPTYPLCTPPPPSHRWLYVVPIDGEDKGAFSSQPLPLTPYPSPLSP